MAKGINKVILVGWLGQDPEFRYAHSGEAVATLSVATQEEWKDKNENKQQRTEWHRVVCFGKLAEIAKQYLAKGSRIYLEGRLQTRKWQAQDGKNHYTTEIVMDEMLMLDGLNRGKSDVNTKIKNGWDELGLFDDDIAF